METNLHTFHIPVMGTGYTADSPVRVAPLGLSSVISLVDDLLLERIRKHYSAEYNLPYEPIGRNVEDGRAKRITAYLNMVADIVDIRIAEIKALPYFENNEKSKYFTLLPDDSPLKKDWQRLILMDEGAKRDAAAKALDERIVPGSIDVNIMVKLDKINRDGRGRELADEFSDAKAALRGFAESKLNSAIVFSAGINQGLYNYMAQFKDFYRNTMGEIQKKIVVKVSDFRSAMIQGRFLARKGLEVHEFRIESSLNCGGHAFPANGTLLASVLKEIKDKRDQLIDQFKPQIERYYKKMGWEINALQNMEYPLLSVQGGLGNHGEDLRMREFFGVERTGWASPFLLVPEATSVDEKTRQMLADAKEEDFYLADTSPMGVPYNNIRGNGSELWHKKLADAGKPGSPCPKNFLISNTEFTKVPICTASRAYMRQKLAQIDAAEISEQEKEEQRAAVHVKNCICDHLGNSSLLELGIEDDAEKNPQAICPGPNTAWFDRFYTLEEMVDHIYGRCASLVPDVRPHMFVKEITMNMEWLTKLVKKWQGNLDELKVIEVSAKNLEEGMLYCNEIAKEKPYPGENLASIPQCVQRELANLKALMAEMVEKLPKFGMSEFTTSFSGA